MPRYRVVWGVTLNAEDFESACFKAGEMRKLGLFDEFEVVLLSKLETSGAGVKTVYGKEEA